VSIAVEQQRYENSDQKHAMSRKSGLTNFKVDDSTKEPVDWLA